MSTPIWRELRQWSRFESSVAAGTASADALHESATDRLDEAVSDQIADPVAVCLAIRLPYARLLQPIHQGDMSTDDFAALTDTLIDSHLAIGERLLSQYTSKSKAWRRKSESGYQARKNLAGYFGELSFQLLMLRKSIREPLVVLPSLISEDVFAPKDGELSTSYDSLLLHSDNWHLVQVKSGDNRVGTQYRKDIAVITGADLGHEPDPELRLPLTGYERFVSLRDNTCSKNRKDAISRSANKVLTKILMHRDMLDTSDTEDDTFKVA